MTAEAIPHAQLEKKNINVLPEYPACGGHPGSSSHNWVPTDYLGYIISKALHVTDEDYKKKVSQK